MTKKKQGPLTRRATLLKQLGVKPPKKMEKIPHPLGGTWGSWFKSLGRKKKK
jgi:hypothetical protein